MSMLARALAGFFIAWIVVSYAAQIALNLLAIPKLRRRLALRPLEGLPPVYAGFEPPVTVIVPAHDEEGTIEGTVRALLDLDYAEFEVVVVNDGSADGTLAALQQAFQLESFPEAHWRRIPTQPVITIYHSRAHANLRVVHKEHGGRADALNVGINASRYPLFCAVDGTSLLRRDVLRRVVEPFLDDPATVASAGAARLSNGCRIVAGKVESIALPASFLALLQIVEDLRASLFARLGWSHINAALIVSESFTVYRKDAVVEAGGYRTGIVGEDTELAVRLHRALRARGERYAIRFLPDPVRWIAAPESLAALRAQRIDRQVALAASLHENRALPRTPGAGGAAGLLAYPFFKVFECYGPAIELAGYLAMAAMAALGWIDVATFVAFLALAFSMGLLLSVTGLALEEISFRSWPRLEQSVRLATAALVENLGYRQWVAWWRVIGLARWLRESRARKRAGQRRG